MSRKTKPALWLQLPGRKRGPRLARVSDREQRLYRREARAAVQLARARGEVCPVLLALHNRRAPVECVHHVRGRLGALLRERRYWLLVSLEGHRWVEDNKEAARASGWLCARGDWGKL